MREQIESLDTGRYRMTAPTAEELRQAVLEELRALGFELRKGELIPPSKFSKVAARRLHEPAKLTELARRQEWLRKNMPRYLPYFAEGDEVVPEKIEPVLAEVKEKW